MKKYETAESVTNGHPDKVCDLLSDAILDAYLKVDPESFVACEVAIYENGILVMGEITSKGKVDIEKIVRSTILKIGYDRTEKGFDGNRCEVQIKVHQQSPDIASGVRQAEGIGAGDQGVMVGYATDETPEYLPCPVVFANRLARRLIELREEHLLPYLYPDGKVQVTVLYEDFIPCMITSIVVAAQHSKQVSVEQVRADLLEKLIDQTIPVEWMSSDTKIIINGTGRFVLGGPFADSGLTGRKLMVDTYGSIVPHGGGAFSGKDCTKVDRSAAYYARYVAKNIVLHQWCHKAQVTLCYAIGGEKPLAVSIDTFGTLREESTMEELQAWVMENFHFAPKEMIGELDLRRPIYQKTACLGHFGREEFPWEQYKE